MRSHREKQHSCAKWFFVALSLALFFDIPCAMCCYLETTQYTLNYFIQHWLKCTNLFLLVLATHRSACGWWPCQKKTLTAITFQSPRQCPGASLARSKGLKAFFIYIRLLTHRRGKLCFYMSLWLLNAQTLSVNLFNSNYTIFIVKVYARDFQANCQIPFQYFNDISIQYFFLPF